MSLARLTDDQLYELSHRIAEVGPAECAIADVFGEFERRLRDARAGAVPGEPPSLLGRIVSARRNNVAWPRTRVRVKLRYADGSYLVEALGGPGEREEFRTCDVRPLTAEEARAEVAGTDIP